jgi:amidase
MRAQPLDPAAAAVDPPADRSLQQERPMPDAGQPALDPVLEAGAARLRAMMQRGEVSAEQVMQAHLDRIAAVNPTLNALVSLRPAEDCLAEARAADAARAAGAPLGPLAGLPVAIKDLAATRGLRTTKGSPLFADWVPEADAPMVARLRAAGAIVIGKTNTPEYGLGSNTFRAGRRWRWPRACCPWPTART